MEHVRAVLEALPAEVGEMVGDINVDGEFRRATERLYDADMAKSLSLELKNGKEFKWCIARPQAVMRSLLPISPALRRAKSKQKKPVVLRFSHRSASQRPIGHRAAKNFFVSAKKAAGNAPNRRPNFELRS